MLYKNIERMVKMKGRCLSIILPNPVISKVNAAEVILRGLTKARLLVNSAEIPDAEKQALLLKIEQVRTDLPKNFSPGIGIFLSPTDSLVVDFPFKVKRRITLAESFESRDMLYLMEYLSPYLVLSLSKTEVRLFRGEKDQLTEVEDDDFPVSVPADYEYNRASISSSTGYSLKGVERDKSVILSVRLKTMLRTAEHRLLQHRRQFSPLIILAGTERLISYYLEITRLPKEEFLRVSGSYGHRSVKILGARCWQAVLHHKQKTDDALVRNLRENDNGHLAKGIEESWQAINEGRGLILAVERDYRCQAYVDQTHGVRLKAPKRPFKVLPDAVSALLEDAGKKRMRVILVENNKLRDFGHVAVQFRY